MNEDISVLLRGMLDQIEALDAEDSIDAINEIKEHLHEVSPFKNEPVDFVKWVKNDAVYANDYNPNAVAPPEMELLERSIDADGYTQPIVTWPTDKGREVVDGFHRHRVGRESLTINERVQGYLPVVAIRAEQDGKNDRIASTIRHNRARGKHKVEAMSDIVIELKKRNWSDNKIAKELGMDSDEVLRLCQITGLTEVFSDEDFSNAWDATIMSGEDMQHIDEEDIQSDAQAKDNGRVFHEWQHWECYPAGFYSDKPPAGMTAQDCEESYRDFLANIPRFEEALKRVISEWVISCEHYLTNEKMNRIAWLGQASMCIENGVPARFCGGYNMLTDEQKNDADKKALDYLNVWLEATGRETLSSEEADSKTAANLY
jgi:ParB-like chromosome segregation protein Spo0J